VDTLNPRMVKILVTLTMPDSRTWLLMVIFSTRPVTNTWLLKPKNRPMRITLDMITLIKQRVAKLLTISSTPSVAKSLSEETTLASTLRMRKPLSCQQISISPLTQLERLTSRLLKMKIKTNTLWKDVKPKLLNKCSWPAMTSLPTLHLLEDMIRPLPPPPRTSTGLSLVSLPPLFHQT